MGSPLAAALWLACAAAPAPQQPRALATLHVGDALPDAALLDSSGAPVRLRQWDGQVVALTFVFTRCAMAEFCPRLSQTFASLQKKLAKARFPWHLVTITFDPAHDTPEVLAAYARRWGAQPGRWSFLTGEPATIDALCEQFDVQRVQEGAVLQHTLATAVVGPDGKIRALFPDSSFGADALAAEMLKASRPAR